MVEPDTGLSAVGPVLTGYRGLGRPAVLPHVLQAVKNPANGWYGRGSVVSDYSNVAISGRRPVDFNWSGQLISTGFFA